MDLMKSLILSLWLLADSASAEGARILLIAGSKSAVSGVHEYPPACALLAKWLRGCGLPVTVDVSLGWPQDPAKVAAADTIVIYSDGLAGNVAVGHVAELRSRYDAGKGLAAMHCALKPENAEMAGLFDDALGGSSEPDGAEISMASPTRLVLGKHPSTRGIEPFDPGDEFCSPVRLRRDIMPLLQASPPADGMVPEGLCAGSPPQTLAWVVSNSNLSRGFGFSGGHFHHCWTDPDFRKLVLNSIVWTAGVEVPDGGVASKVPAAPVYPSIDEAIAKGDLDDVCVHLAIHPTSLEKGDRETSRPPLEQAVIRNKTEITLFLLESGANPNTVNASMRTPLHLAVDRNNPVVVAALLKAGARPNERDNDGWTPLHHAAAKNQLETARALLAGGADPNVLSLLGGTPLHEAAVSGGVEIIRLLIAHKVDPTVVSKQAVTALDIARQYKNQPAIDELFK